MKKVLVIISFLMTSLGADAQSINDFQLADFKGKYLLLRIDNIRTTSGHLRVRWIDAGKNYPTLNTRKGNFKDKNDQRIKFESIVDFIDFMESNSPLELFSHSVESDEYDLDHHLVFRRKE